MKQELKKGKHPEAVVVHKKDGKTFTRVQKVGSDKNPTEVKHPIHKFIENGKRDEYDNFLHNLREINGKYYNKEKIDKPSSGRTSFGRGMFDGLVEYQLHPSEVSYKKKLHKEKGEPKHDKKETDSLAQETIYERGVFPSKKSDVHNKILDANTKTSESIHKKLDTNYGKKLKDKESKEFKEHIKQIEKEASDKTVENVNGRISKVNEKLNEFTISEKTNIKEFFDKFKVDLAGLSPYGSKIQIDFTTTNGSTQTRTLKSLRDWVKNINEDPNPSLKEAKLPFTKIKINSYNIEQK